MKELEKLRSWAVHGNWRKWGRFVTIFEALDERLDAVEKSHSHKPIFDRLRALGEANNINAERVENRLSALETNEDVDQRASLVAQALIHDRLSALEHDTFEHDARLEAIETVEGEQKPKPLTCCEGCAEFQGTCDKWQRAFCGPDGRAVCYREKKTCGDCIKPYRREGYEDFACFDHPCLAIGNYERPSWRLPASPACPNFEAIQ